MSRRRANGLTDPVLLVRHRPNMAESRSRDKVLFDQLKQVSHDTEVGSPKTTDHSSDFGSPGGSVMWRVDIQIGKNQRTLTTVMDESLVQRAELAGPYGSLEAARLKSVRCQSELGEHQEYLSRKSCSNSESFSGQG